MTIPFEVYIATRYLLARRRQAFISLISVVSIGGVATGTPPLNRTGAPSLSPAAVHLLSKGSTVAPLITVLSTPTAVIETGLIEESNSSGLVPAVASAAEGCRVN